ncbi:MAG: hypothetical protein ACRCVT_09645 [Leadbetterella sp.]
MNSKIKLIYIFIPLFFSCHTGFSQCESKLQSKLAQIRSIKDLDEKLISFEKESYKYWSYIDSTHAAQTLFEGLNLAKSRGNRAFESIFESHLARFYTLAHKNPKLADQYLLSASQKTSDNRSQGVYWYSKGKILENNSDKIDDKALECYLKAIDFLKDHKQWDFIVVSTYQHIANIYYQRLIYDKQMYYANEGLNFIKKAKINDIDVASIAHFTMANTYTNFYKSKKELKYLEKSKQMYNYIFEINKGNDCFPEILIASYYNMAVAYGVVQSKPDLDSAMIYLNKVKEIYEARNKKVTLTTIPNYIKMIPILSTKLLLIQKKVSAAKIELEKAPIYYPNLRKDPSYATKYYYLTSEIAFYEKRFKDAYVAKNKELLMLDSLYNIEKLGEIQKVETQFKNYKQEQELFKVRAENASRKRMNYFYLALISLFIVSIVFIIRSNNLRKKNFQQTQDLLEKENLNVLMEKEIAENEAILAIQEKILTEQQKEALQESLLYNSLQIERKNDLIKQLQDGMYIMKNNKQDKEVDISKINKSLELDLKAHKDLDFIQDSFAQTDPKFFKLLHEKAIQPITPLDLKYCSYIRMGMSNREIANIMNIESNSMRMAKYRLKQKLNLSKEEDLEFFIRNL